MSKARVRVKRAPRAIAACVAGVGFFFSTSFDSVLAQSAQQSAGRQISIPAQPLASALVAFSRQTGVAIFAASSVTSGKRSSAVGGNMRPDVALRTLLAGTGLSYTFTSATSAKVVAGGAVTPLNGSETLDEIVVEDGAGQQFFGTAPADTGTTVMSGDLLQVRKDGTGDANAILKNLPNVQYQNEAKKDGGDDDQSVIDLKPKEMSISGARVYENNFIIDGMPTNNVAGSVERFGDEDLSDGFPNADRIYGLHSQTVYVPAEFLDTATVMDSNVSAQYGNFQGGVVSYKLNEPAKDRLRTTVTTDYSTSDWAEYNLKTETKTNPNNVQQPDFIKKRGSLTVTGPVNDWLSILGQVSHEEALTHKDKQYRYYSQRAEEDSDKNFYRFKANADTRYGEFSAEVIYDTYRQLWESHTYRDFKMDIGKDTLTAKLENTYKIGDQAFAGISFGNVKLTSRMSYSGSETTDDASGNIARQMKQTEWSPAGANGKVVWTSTELSDWCRTDPTLKQATLCYDGAWGDSLQKQKQVSWSEAVTGDVFLGKFSFGTDYAYTDAKRARPEDFIYYSQYTTAYTAKVSQFDCSKTSEECSKEQFSNTKTIWQAYDIDAQLHDFGSYAELDQTWRWFNVRAGARASLDSYMHNLDIAPRLVATVTPFEDLSVSGGYNRYYNANSLAYAIRDQQPRGQSYARAHDSGTVSNSWTTRPITGNYTNSASGLDTPFSDERTISVAGKEPLLDGSWRIRFLDRRSFDQYASDANGTTYTLTNNGKGFYESVTGEYLKRLNPLTIPHMDALAFNASFTWSRQRVSHNNYYVDDLIDDRIWYNGKSYSLGGFGAVLGNLDIPMRLQMGFTSKWFDDALSFDIFGNYNLAFRGIRDTEEKISIDGVTHDIYEDFDYSSRFTVDVASAYTFFKEGDTSFTVDGRIDNVFNETGNATATNARPWIIGRTVWVGAKATF
ncbi:TonB-dependent receptor [Rhodomicrobium udaipurense]|uniref:TonB-dependent receptor plug domain-containing protein n=1 Tax=Rhodomicrobium udaipurense TaxID=1202716 RepID=A0A8I1KJR5_9HYPH|nr:STN domain-containing protein [Rhodomicrobium udaipurense]MBJ7544107.1 TonB-dependent receptor plug domain-containing protein [Rhodomicrobium udaipurense]